MRFSSNNRCTIRAFLLAAISLFLFGCGGGGGTPTVTAPAAFTVSGKVSLNGAGISGVTVTHSGGSAAKSTDASGNYSFTGAGNGIYTITPSLAGYTFSPLSRNITVANDNVTVPEFTATATTASTFTMSGKVTFNGTGFPGITMNVTGAATGSKLTDINGDYTFSGLQDGTYTITPSAAGYTFAPASQDITITGGNVTVAVFTATASASVFTASGTVSLNGAVLAGVNITISDAGGTPLVTIQTNQASSSYLFNVPNGTFTITPSLEGHTFTPSSRTFTINNANLAGQDFTATIPGSGTITFTF